MPIARVGGSRPIRISRYDRGICRICKQPVLHGEAYCYTGGTTIDIQYLVHYDCYKPANAPTWKELLQIQKLDKKRGLNNTRG